MNIQIDLQIKVGMSNRYGTKVGRDDDHITIWNQ